MIFDPEKVSGWNFLSMPGKDWCRVYWIQKPEGNGFDFTSFEVTSTSSDCGTDGNPFEHGGTEVEILLHGYACFDGVRHLYFGTTKTENWGYFYYQDLRILKWLIEILEGLEKKFCNFPAHEYERKALK